MVYSTGSAEHRRDRRRRGVRRPASWSRCSWRQDAGVGPGDVLTVQGERGDRRERAGQRRLRDAHPAAGPVLGGPRLPLPPHAHAAGRARYPPPAILASKDVTLATALAVDEDVLASSGWSRWTTASTSPARARPPTTSSELQAAMADPESAGHPAGRPRRASRARRPDSALPGVARDRGPHRRPARPRRCGPWASAAAPPPSCSSAPGPASAIRRRDDELRSLVARGLSPARGAGQAAAEAVLPVVVGSPSAARSAGRWSASSARPPILGPRRPAARPCSPWPSAAWPPLAVVAAVTAVLRRPPRPGRPRPGRPAAAPRALARRHRGGHRRRPRCRWSPEPTTDRRRVRRPDPRSCPLLVDRRRSRARSPRCCRAIGRRADARLRRLPPAGLPGRAPGARRRRAPPASWS